MPNLSSREAILRASTRKAKLGEGVDFFEVAKATQNYSAADLAEICQKAI
jgi:transitional endoplasmic reticulum ATPase